MKQDLVPIQNQKMVSHFSIWPGPLNLSKTRPYVKQLRSVADTSPTSSTTLHIHTPITLIFHQNAPITSIIQYQENQQESHPVSTV